MYSNKPSYSLAESLQLLYGITSNRSYWYILVSKYATVGDSYKLHSSLNSVQVFFLRGLISRVGLLVAVLQRESVFVTSVQKLIW